MLVKAPHERISKPASHHALVCWEVWYKLGQTYELPCPVSRIKRLYKNLTIDRRPVGALEVSCVMLDYISSAVSAILRLHFVFPFFRVTDLTLFLLRHELWIG